MTVHGSILFAGRFGRLHTLSADRAAQNSPSFRMMGGRSPSRFFPPGEFVGESLASAGGLHLATARPGTACTALGIGRGEMIRVIHEQHSLSEMYLKFLLVRSMRTQADLVDQLFNSSERRLARFS